MSRKNIILLVLFLILISTSIAFYLYIKNQELAKKAEDAEKAAHVDAVMTELKNFKSDSPARTMSKEEILKELNSFKPSVVTDKNTNKASASSVNTTKTNTNTSATTSASIPVAPKSEVKPKTKEEVFQELNSFKAPAKSSSSNTTNLLNSYKN